MAFMVPIVKNHYDIYANKTPPDSDSNSLYLSATSLNGRQKQYRILITGGKVVNGKKSSSSSTTTINGAGKVGRPGGGVVKPVNPAVVVGNNNNKTPNAVAAPAKATVGSKIYYRLPSASISLPITSNGRGGGGNAALARTGGALAVRNGGASVIRNGDRYKQNTNVLSHQQQQQQTTKPSSPTGSVSRPLPHVLRTVRNPHTNRVYSYSVSIPDYVAEEDEEEEEEEEEDDNLDMDLSSTDIDDDDDDDDEDDDEYEHEKENHNLNDSMILGDSQVMLFSTSAPAGTGPIVTPTPSPPINKVEQEKMIKKNNNKLLTQCSKNNEMKKKLNNNSGTKKNPAICPNCHQSLTVSLPASPTDGSMPASTQRTLQQIHQSACSSCAALTGNSGIITTTTTTTNGSNNNVSNNANANGQPRARSNTSSSSASATNSREYVELLRKFVLHLKMLKIGGKIFHTNNNGEQKDLADNDATTTTTTAPIMVRKPNKRSRSKRKRNDTLEDCKQL